MRSKSYRINITPIAWQSVIRNNNRSYDNNAKDRISFGLYLSQQHDGEPFFSNPIHIEATFFMPIAKTLKGREDSFYHSKTPYMENLYQFLLDAMKGIVISDERVICSISLKKVYDKEPRTELVISEVV